MSPQTRLKLGVALLILGLIMPAGTLLVAITDWPVAVKTVLSSILLFGFEIMIIPAVALMGKDNFDRIWAGAMRLLKTLSTCWWFPSCMPGSQATLPPGCRRTTSCGFGSMLGSISWRSPACSS